MRHGLRQRCDRCAAAPVGGQGRRRRRCRRGPPGSVASLSWRAHRLDLVRGVVQGPRGNEKLLGSGRQPSRRRPKLANKSLTTADSLPAWRRYTGVVWEALDVASLPPIVKRRSMSSAVVVSGLLGLAALDDPTPEYRLKIGASLAPFGKLSTWWRPSVGKALTAWAAQRFVVDLLPNEHRAACRISPVARRLGDLRRSHRPDRRARRQGSQGTPRSASADLRAVIPSTPCTHGRIRGSTCVSPRSVADARW